MMRMKESEIKKTMEIELLTIKTERDLCASKTRDSELKLKDLEWLRIALERKCENDIDEFKKSYQREWDTERREFESKKRQLDEETYMFNLNKERYLANEAEKSKLEKENTELRIEKDKLLYSSNEIKDQLRVLSNNALRDNEIIQTKTIEARSSGDEAKTYKSLLDETRMAHTRDKEGLTQLVDNLRLQLKD